MKFVVFMLICVGICCAFEKLCESEDFKSIEEKCLAANGGDRELIENFLNMKKSSSEEEKCYRACLMEECKFMDASGNLNPNTYKGYLKRTSHGDALKQNLMGNTFEKCQQTTIVDENKCSTAGDYYDCLIDNCKTCGWDFHGI